MANACEECTLNCDMMHRRKKDPSPLVTTFFKVMMGDTYSKTMYLPPQFARTVKKLVDKQTLLEDSNGEKWKVKCTTIDGRLVFKEGWNKFVLDHGLKQGDLLVFHHIKRSHFVVLMYGPSGCPENRHFGLLHHKKKETKKNDNNLTVNNQSPTEVHTTCNDFLYDSSSKSVPLVHGVNNAETDNEKLDEVNTSPNENTTNTQHLVASSSQPLDKETDQVSESLDKNTNEKTDQRSELLVKNTDKETDQRSELLAESTIPDGIASKSPTTVKSSGLVDTGNRHEADESGRNILQQTVAKLDSDKKNNAATSCVGSDKTKSKITQEEFEKTQEELERRIKLSDERRKENTIRQSQATHSSSMLKRSRPASVPNTPEKMVKREPDTSASRLHNGNPFSGIPPKPMGTPEKIVKMEPDTSASRLHNGGNPFIGISPKSVAKPMESIKKEATMNYGSPTNDYGLLGLIKKEPKSEPVDNDNDDAPLSDPSLASFSATMCSYQYLELPDTVNFKSGVFLLRNGTDLWAVLFQTKFGIKALTQNWGTYAKERGIKPGHTCMFVRESAPKNRYTCNVFNVYVTRK